MSKDRSVSRSVSSSSTGLGDDPSCDTLSVVSYDDLFYEDHHFSKDRFSKQRRRGSGLGGIASYFKSSIKVVLASGSSATGGDGSSSNLAESNSNLADIDSSNHSDKGNSPKGATCVSEKSPREFLDVMFRTRGYSRETYNAVETAYYNEPSPLQVASYGPRLLEMAQSNEIAGVRSFLATGISPNPTSENGESLLHKVCRLGLLELLTVLVDDFGASVQICDRNGKTPLHDACVGGPEGPHFSVVDFLATKDRRLFNLKDVNGKTPLDYVPLDHWGAWIDFLYVRRDTYWPRRLVRIDGPEEPPALAKQDPNSRPAVDPISALSLDLAGLVVSGEISPEQALEQKMDNGREGCDGVNQGEPEDGSTEAASTDDSSTNS